MKYLKRGVNTLKKCKYTIVGLDCADCASKIQASLSHDKHFDKVSVNFSTSKISFETDYDTNIVKKANNLIKAVEPEAHILDAQSTKRDFTIYNLLRIILAVAILISTYFVANDTYTKVAVIIAYILLIARVFVNAIKQLFHFTIDENFLITVSCIGAYAINEYMEGAMVLILYEIGKILESRAINHSRKSISHLMDIKPDYANLADGQKVNPDTVQIGDVIVVKPGEKIPLDGVIIEGSSSLDTSSLTGESKPTNVTKGDDVLSGSINQSGLLKIKVTSSYDDSTVNKVLKMVEEATERKAKTETFVSKLSKIYTPIVIALALLVAIFLPYIIDISYEGSIYRALSFLVIACPCAIVISVPLSYFSGIGSLSKKGILIKGSNYLDAIKDIREFVFDKTGTLTDGHFTVTNVTLLSSEEDTFARYLLMGEKLSNHPLALAILDHYQSKDISLGEVSDYKEVAGYGIEYTINGKVVKVGNAKLVGYQKEEGIGTHIYVSVDDVILGYITLNDTIKNSARELINTLKKRNLMVSMFTGDNKDIAKNVALELGIDDYYGAMLPQDKYQKLEEKINKGHKVAFVGDGVNDAPVLARADVGLSLGLSGSSAAIETSDVVILTDDLLKINYAIDTSYFTSKVIKQNLTFAFIVKILVLILSVLGISTMWQAVFADVGVTIITILNTLRILKH